jgi:hypothetical protein
VLFALLGAAISTDGEMGRRFFDYLYRRERRKAIEWLRARVALELGGWRLFFIANGNADMRGVGGVCG